MVANGMVVCYSITTIKKRSEVMFFCTGEQRLSLDDKGRMRIPMKMFEKLGKDFVVYAGTNDCLFVVPMKDFQEKYYEISQDLLLNEKEKQEALRKLSSTVQVPEIDAQGRFILQPKLKAVAKISKKMVFLGVMDRIEIWSEEVYDARYSVDNIDMTEVVNTLKI